MIPATLQDVRQYLSEQKLDLDSKNEEDGRLGSAIDEKYVIDLLLKKFPDRIVAQKSRHWFDISVKDDVAGLLPVNIKITTAKSADNIGNLTPCVYAYTRHSLDMKKTYQNGKLAIMLIDALVKQEYNTDKNKDYWFLVINKNTHDVYINSMLGLSTIVSNSNNLPFQIAWKNNKVWKDQSIENSINMFIAAYRNMAVTWQAKFIDGMKKLAQPSNSTVASDT